MRMNRTKLKLYTVRAKNINLKRLVNCANLLVGFSRGERGTTFKTIQYLVQSDISRNQPDFELCLSILMILNATRTKQLN